MTTFRKSRDLCDFILHAWLYLFRQVVALFCVNRSTWRRLSVDMCRRQAGLHARDYSEDSSDPSLAEKVIDLLVDVLKKRLDCEESYQVSRYARSGVSYVYRPDFDLFTLPKIGTSLLEGLRVTESDQTIANFVKGYCVQVDKAL